MLTWNIQNCNMQYVGQTCRKLKNRSGEQYCKIKKPKKIDTFLYQHFKRTGHSPDNILVQPVEKLIYEENSSVRFNTIKRLETELKWIKLLQSASPIGFNDNIYQEGNISKLPEDFDVFSLLEIRKRKRRSHGKRQKGNDKRKRCAAQKSGTSLYNVSSKLREHGRIAMLSFLSSLPVPVIGILDIVAKSFMIGITKCMRLDFWLDAILNTLSIHLSMLKLITKDILSKSLS